MNIRIKNVSRNVTTDSLAAIFTTHGEVTSATIDSDKIIAGEPATAVVVMPDAAEAGKAVEQLNGCFVDGLAIEVETVQPEARLPIFTCYRRIRRFLLPNKNNPSFI